MDIENKINQLDLSGNTSYVYFMQIGDNEGPIKIGFTKKLKHRFSVIQLSNPMLVTLLTVFPGGRREEFELHKQLKKYKVYGEWFEPNEELYQIINKYPILNLLTVDFQNSIKIGSESHNWKGDEASQASKQQRARAFKRRDKRFSEKCDRCGNGKGLDMVFLDGNKNNLQKDNVFSYCRRCRMEKDGTLNILLTSPKKENILKECIVCGKLSNAMRHGRCHSCNEFFRRNNCDRHEKTIEIKKCNICESAKKVVKGRCHNCYEYFLRNNIDKNEVDIETEEILKLQFLEDIKDKVKLMRKLYNSGKFTGKFLYTKADISANSFSQIIRNIYYHNPEYVYSPKFGMVKNK